MNKVINKKIKTQLLFLKKSLEMIICNQHVYNL